MVCPSDGCALTICAGLVHATVQEGDLSLPLHHPFSLLSMHRKVYECLLGCSENMHMNIQQIFLFSHTESRIKVCIVMQSKNRLAIRHVLSASGRNGHMHNSSNYGQYSSTDTPSLCYSNYFHTGCRMKCLHLHIHIMYIVRQKRMREWIKKLSRAKNECLNFTWRIMVWNFTCLTKILKCGIHFVQTSTSCICERMERWRCPIKISLYRREANIEWWTFIILFSMRHIKILAAHLMLYSEVGKTIYLIRNGNYYIFIQL